MTHIFLPITSGFCMSAALIMAIGAQNMFVLQQGLKREYITDIVIFCSLADAVLIAIGVSGTGAFLKAFPWVTNGLTLGGAIFLTWYGITALRRMLVPSRMLVNETPPVSRTRVLTMVAAFTFLNPHVYLDTVLLMGVAGSTQPPQLRGFFAAGAMSASIMWFAALGFGSHLLQPLFNRPAAWQVLDGIVGSVMLTMAVLLIFNIVHPMAVLALF